MVITMTYGVSQYFKSGRFGTIAVIDVFSYCFSSQLFLCQILYSYILNLFRQYHLGYRNGMCMFSAGLGMMLGIVYRNVHAHHQTRDSLLYR